MPAEEVRSTSSAAADVPLETADASVSPVGADRKPQTSSSVAERLYVVLLTWGIVQRRMFLRGLDSEAARSSFLRVVRELSRLAESASSWPEFLAEARRRFVLEGFVEVKH